MGKRILSFLLAVVMVFGMVPATAIPTFAAETEPQSTTPASANLIANRGTVTVDGALTESDWRTYGKMTKTEGETTTVKNFGVLWDAGYLYLGGTGAVTTLTVKVNGQTFDTAAVSKAADNSAWELKIPFSAVDVSAFDGLAVPVEVTLDGHTWNGTVTLDMAKWVYHYAIAPTLNTGKYVKATTYDSGNRVVFANKYDANYNSGKTAGNARIYSFKQSITEIPSATEISVVEFDFTATDIPEYYTDVPARTAGDNTFGSNGMALGFYQTNYDMGYAIGITNTKNNGLYFWVNGAANKNDDFRYAKMNKANGDSFHVRLELDPAETLTVYIDDVYLASFENVVINSGWNGSGTKMVNLNLYATSAFTPVASGEYDLEFEVSNFNISKKNPTAAATALNANVTATAPELDGALSEADWIMPQALTVTNGDAAGDVSVMWGEACVYFGIRYSNADKLTLSFAGQTWENIPLTETINQGALTGCAKNGIAELKLDLAKARIAVTQYGQAYLMNVTLLSDTSSAALASAPINVTLSGMETVLQKPSDASTASDGAYRKLVTLDDTNNTITINDTSATRAFWGKTGFAELLVANDKYLEQTITITQMPASSGTLRTYQADGYFFWMSEASGGANKTTLANVYHTGDNALKLRVQTSVSPNYVDIPLGVSVGDTFTLGYYYDAENFVEVYVNDVLLATVENVLVTNSSSGDKALCLGHYNNNQAKNINMVIKNMHMTIIKRSGSMSVSNAQALKNVLDELDLRDLHTDLPASVVWGDFCKPITWSGSSYVSEAGAVTAPAVPTTVTLTPTIDDTAMTPVTVTLQPSNYINVRLAGTLADGALDQDSIEWNLIGWHSLGSNAQAAFLVSGGKVYVAVKGAAEGTALTAKLGDETVASGTAGTGIAVLELNKVLTHYGQRLENFSLTAGSEALTGTLWIADQLIPEAVQMPINGTSPNGFTTKDVPVVDQDAKTLTFTAPYTKNSTTTYATDSSTCAYSIQKNNFWNLLNLHQDILFEQDITIESMPLGDLSGAFSNTSGNIAPTNGNGFTILLERERTNDALSQVGVIVRDDKNNLHFNVLKSDKDVASIALGKQLNQQFKLGLLWSGDGNTITVYVDNVLKGTVTNTGVATDKIYTKTGYGLAMLEKYQDPANKEGNENAVITVSFPTVTNVGKAVDAPVELSREKVLDNVNIDNLVGNADLPASHTTSYFGEVPLTWSWENAEGVVDNDNNVWHSDTAKNLNLKLSVDGDLINTFGVTVPAAKTLTVSEVKAVVAETVTVDGKLLETEWLDFVSIGAVSHNPYGGIAAAWGKGKVYFAGNFANAETLTLTVNGVALQVDLLNQQVTNGSGAAVEGAQVAVLNGVMELSVPMSALNLVVTAYEQACTFAAQLAKGEKTASITGANLIFSGNTPAVQALNTYSRQNTTTVTFPVKNTSAKFEFTQNFTSTAKPHDLYKSNVSHVDHSKDMVLSQDLCFYKMPVTTIANASQGTTSQGYYFLMPWNTIEDPKDAKYTSGVTFVATIYNAGDGKLKLAIRDMGYDTVLDLGKGLNEPFRLSVAWNADKSLEVYVDGKLIGVKDNAEISLPSIGKNALILRYNNVGVTDGQEAHFTVSNVSFLATTKTEYTHGLTTQAILEAYDIDINAITENLPNEIVSGDFLYPVTWVAVEGAVDADGTIYRGKLNYQSVTLQALVNGEAVASCEVKIKPTVAEIPAYFAGGVEDAALTASSYVWQFAKWQDLGDTYKVAALISGGNIFMAVDGLDNGKEITAYLDGNVVAGGTVTDGRLLLKLDVPVTRYGQALVDLQLKDGETDLCPAGITVQVMAGAISLQEAAAVPTEGATNRWFDIKNGAFSWSRTGKTDALINNSNGAYFIQGAGVAELINPKEDILFTQDLKITAMPVNENAYAGSDPYNDAHGYNIHLQFPSTTGGTYEFFSSVISVDEEGQLYIWLLKADGTNTGAIKLTGATLGQQFTLKLLWGKDGSVTVFVGDTKITTVENARFTRATANADIYKTDATLLLKYKDEVNGLTGANNQVTFYGSIPTLTMLSKELNLATEFQVEDVLSEELRAQLANVTAPVELPKTYTTKYLSNVELTWTAEPNVLGEDGYQIVLPEEKQETVTLTLYANGTEIGTYSAKVQSKYNRFADLPTWEDIANGQSQNTVTGALNLQTEYDDGLHVEWSAVGGNTELIDCETGTVTRLEGDAEVTLRVSIVDAPDLYKEYTFTIVGTLLDTYLTHEPMTADGDLNEVAWAYAKWYTMADGNQAAFLVKDGVLYLAVKGENSADATVTLTKGNAVVDWDKAKSIEGIVTTATGDNLELQIDLKTLGMQILNYGEQPFTIAINGDKLLQTTLNVLCKEIVVMDAAGRTPVGNSGSFANGVETIINSKDVSKAENVAATILYKENTISKQLDFTKDLLYSQDIQFNKLPVSDGGGSGYGFNGYNLGLFDIETEEAIAVYLFRDSNDDLYVGISGKSKVKLTQAWNAKINLTLQYTAEEQALIVYVDGELVLSATSVLLANTKPYSQDSVMHKFLNSGVAAEIGDVEIFVSNVAVIADVPALTEELTTAGILSGWNLTSLRGGEVLPVEVQSKHLGLLPLTWTGEKIEEGKIAVVSGTAIANDTLVASVGETALDSVAIKIIPTAFAEAITKEAVLPATISPLYASGNVVSLMPTYTVEGAEVDLVWSSSDETVFTASNDQLTAVAPGKAQLKLAIVVAGIQVDLWSVEVIVPTLLKEEANLNAYLVDSVHDLTADAWVMPETYSSKIGGNTKRIYAAWSAGETLYLAIEGLAEQTVTITLGDVSVENVTLDTNGGCTIALSEFDIDLQNYNKSFRFQVTLGETNLLADGTTLTFTGMKQDLLVDGPVTGFSTPNATSGQTYKTIKSGDQGLDVANQAYIVTQTLKVNDLSAATGEIVNGLPDGYYLVVNDNIGTRANGNPENRKLYVILYTYNEQLYIRAKGSTMLAGYPMGVEAEETFKLDCYWYNGTVKLYVNGNCVATYENFVGEDNSDTINNSIILYSFGAYNVKTSNIYATTARCDIQKEITLYGLLGEDYEMTLLGLTEASEPITLPLTFNSQYLGDVSLTWTSSKDEVIAIQGDKLIVVNSEQSAAVTLTVVLSSEMDVELGTAVATVASANVTEEGLPSWNTISGVGDPNFFTGSLNLFEEYNGEQLVWTAADVAGNPVDLAQLINETGAVIRGQNDRTIILKAAYELVPATYKTYEFTVPGTAVNAYLTGEDMYVDGILDEASWAYANWHRMPDGKEVAFLVKDGRGYMDIRGANSATTVALTKGETTVTWTQEIPVDGIVSAMKDDVLELQIDLKALGMQILNYGLQSIQITIDGDPMLQSDLLVLQQEIVPMDSYDTATSENNGKIYGSRGTIINTKDVSDGNKVAALLLYDENAISKHLDFTKDLIYSQKIRIDRMPVSDGKGSTYNYNGYNLGLFDNQRSIFVYIFKTEDGNLNLGISGKTNTVVLEPGMSETFELKLHYMKNSDTLVVFVDGKPVMRVTEPLVTMNPYSQKSVLHKFLNQGVPANPGDVNITIEDAAIAGVPVASLDKELTADKVLFGYDLSRLSAGAVLPEMFASEYLGELPLTWTSALVENYVVKQNNTNEMAEDALAAAVTGGPELWSVNVAVYPSNLEEQISPNAVLGGETLSLYAATETLQLPVTHGEFALGWESSNKAIFTVNENGVLMPVAPGTADLIAYVGELTAPLWRVKVTVPGASEINANIALNAINLDGILNEDKWTRPVTYQTHILNTDAQKQLYVLWGAEKLYLGIEGVSEQTAIKVVLDGTEKTVVIGQDGVTGAIADGVAELCIPLSLFAIDLVDFNTTVSFNVKLDDTSLLKTGTTLCFSGYDIQRMDMNTGSQRKGFTVTDGILTFEQSRERNYWGKNVDNMHHDHDVYLEQTLLIQDMNATGEFTGTSYSTCGANGYYFHISKNTGDPTDVSQGLITMAAIYNDSVEGLVMNVLTNQGELNSKTRTLSPVSVPLGVIVGQAFTLGYLWKSDNSVEIYVNGSHVGSVRNVAFLYQYGGGSDVVMLNNNCDGSVSVSNVSVIGMRYATVADELTADVVLPTVDLDDVYRDITLPTTVTSAYVGDVQVAWEATGALTSNGVITQNATTAGEATLTATFSGNGSWTKNVTVSKSDAVIHALVSQTEINVDGKTSETVWLDWQKFDDHSGTLSVVWRAGKLYFAINPVSAASVTMTVGDKTVVISAADETVTVDGVVLTDAKVAKASVIEVEIPLADLGIAPTDYGYEIPVFNAAAQINGVQKLLRGTSLILSGKIAEVTKLSGYTTSTGPFVMTTNSIGYDGLQPGSTDYAYKTTSDGTGLDHTQLIVMSNDFLFEKLPVTDGQPSSSTAYDGFYFYFSDEDKDTRKGVTIAASIYRPSEDSDALYLAISGGGGINAAEVALGKNLGEQFRLTLYWYPNNVLDVYVDGNLVQTVKNAGIATSNLGIDVISYRYYSEKVTDQAVKWTASNQMQIVDKYETVFDEVTEDALFGRVDADHVQEDLTLLNSFETANFGAMPVEWTVTGNGISADGVVTRTEETQTATLTATVTWNGETKRFTKTLTIDPLTVHKAPAPSVINTTFARNITIDGQLTQEENWLLNGWVLENHQAVGYFGTRWNQSTLYLAIDTKSKNINVTVGGLEIHVNMAEGTVDGVEDATAGFHGTVAEIAIPLSNFNMSGLAVYDLTLDIQVNIEGGSYVGTLKLTSVEWWAADNVHSAMPHGAISISANQNMKQTPNGWYCADLWSTNGENVAGKRSYVLFNKMPIFDNFGDRSEAGYVEFDFYAKDMPVLASANAGEATMERAFSNYGITFSWSDKADGTAKSNVIVFGIVNTAEGLVLVVNGGPNNFDYIDLYANGVRLVEGDEFRLGLKWNLNTDMDVFINGELFTTVVGASKWTESVGDNSFVINVQHGKTANSSAADNMEVYLSNLAFGKAYGTGDLLRYVDYSDILGENRDQDTIKTDLDLSDVQKTSNHQLNASYNITWESDTPGVIAPNGTVNRPEYGSKVVTLTARIAETNESKEFRFVVIAQYSLAGNMLAAPNDTNPFKGKLEAYEADALTLDLKNNSVGYYNESGSRINLVTLHDVDTASKLNRESLRLFVSEDNETYTEIEDYKLHHDGTEWYLYDFETNAKYIKVHYTHRDTDSADFYNKAADMITIHADSSLDIPENAQSVSAPATTLLDEAVKITLPAGIGTDKLRVAQDGKLLFHYVENGAVYVRIPDPGKGRLMLWNGGAENIELADKENVYEVSYGTRETLPTSGRWVLSLKAGQRFPNGERITEDTLYHMSSNAVYASTDGGYTWEKIGSVSFKASLNTGGWGFDSKTGRMFHEFHYIIESMVNDDIDKSHCETYVFYSDDGGKSWNQSAGGGKIEGDELTNYALSYTDITELFGNDGGGENIDFVFPVGVQCNNNGAFSGRVLYSDDGGMSWKYSESVITFADSENAFEGGVSEGTILEREDGTLVYYARCQDDPVDNFAISYSLDHGVTWLTPGEKSSVYTTNTQALMMTYDFGGFDGNRTTGTPMFMWGGNNVLGGRSYYRMPLNFAISTNGMDTFRNIQNIFSETFMDTFSFDADHYITNASIQQIHGDNMYVSFSRLKHKDSIYMVVNDFTNWFLRTKGAYDSFEHGTAQYEGWITEVGNVAATTDNAYQGSYAMWVNSGTNVTRSVPYLQDGTLSFAVYVDSASDFVFELQPAFSNRANDCAVISAKVSGTTMTIGSKTLQLKEGWNTVEFTLELTTNKAFIRINGGNASALVVNQAVGNYITYVTLLTKDSGVYLDELLMVSGLDVQLEATTADQTAANETIGLIQTIAGVDGDKAEAIAAARNSYEKLTQVQKDLVNRRVRISADDVRMEENHPVTEYMINYYDVLVEAEKNYKPSGSDSGTPDIAVKEEPEVPNEAINTEGAGVNSEKVNKDLNNKQTQEQVASVAENLYVPHLNVSQAEVVTALGASYNEEGEAPKVEVDAYLAVAYQAPDGSRMTVDLEALYQVYAVQDETREPMGTPQVMDTTGVAITIRLALPAGFVVSTSQQVTINHYGENHVLKGTYTGTVTGNAADGFVVEFENENGFSEFEILAQDNVTTVEQLIDAIGTVTLDSVDAINAAKAAYENLSAAEKALVGNLDVLTAAEERLAYLGKTSIQYAEVELGDYVGLNFYVKVNDEANNTNAYVLFKNGANSETVTAYTVKTVNGQAYRVYSYKLTAKQMTDLIDVQYVYDATTSATALLTYSVRSYADKALSDSTASAELKQLVKDMLQYGALAQQQFTHNTGNLADSGIVGATELQSVTAEMLKSHKARVDNNFLSAYNIKVYATLILEANTTVRFYFNNALPDEAVVKVDGQVVTPELIDGMYCVDKTGIVARRLDADVVLTIEYKDQIMTVTYSPLSYCYEVLARSTDEILRNLVKSLYRYNQSADAYFTSIGENLN